jgi:hypothetical protein
MEQVVWAFDLMQTFTGYIICNITSNGAMKKLLWQNLIIIIIFFFGGGGLAVHSVI